MKNHNCELTVLIKDRAIAEFAHRPAGGGPAQVFVEGRAGSNYELAFENNNPFRVEAILSVDGLSVTDGKPAGAGSRGYLVDGHRTIRVPGWTLDQAAVAAFAFSGAAGGSYVEQSGGDAANKGALGALVYREKPKVVRPSIAASGAFRGMKGAAFNASAQPSSLLSSAPVADVFAAEQSLGTAFGRKTEFRTQEVAFERGALLAVLEMFYDDIKGLRARGVPVDLPRRGRSEPRAFPGLNTGCEPPAGWQG